MPVYEFSCNRCEKDFEIMCPMGTQVEEVKCPGCNENHVTRKVSVFGFVSAGGSSEAESCGEGACGGGSCATEGFDSFGGCGSCGPSGCGM